MLKPTHFWTLAALFSVVTTASADEATWAREANDRAEIEAVMWRCVRALDTFDADAFASVFTEDGHQGATQGRRAIKAMIAGMKAAQEKNKAEGKPVQPPTQHLSTNVTIDFQDETHARFQGYWTALVVPGQRGMPPRVVVAGREDTLFVKVDGKWLIESRDLAPKN